MNDASTTLRDSRQRLEQGLKAVVKDAEDLLRFAVRDAGEGYAQAREHLEQTLKSAREELSQLNEAAVDGARRAGRATDSYVRRHPWESIGVGAGIGLLLGLLIARR